MRAATLLPLLLLVLGCSASQFDPHPPETGIPSWFEGWYIRLTPDPARQDDASGGPADAADAGAAAIGSHRPASMALIVAAQPNAPPEWNHTLMSLSVQHASLAHPGNTVYERKGMALSITGAGGVPATSSPDLTSPPALTISAADGSLSLRLEGDSCQLTARFGGKGNSAITSAGAGQPEGEKQGEEKEGEEEEAYLFAECTGPPMLWDTTGVGPEGCASALPGSITGLHWFVHSLATPMRYTLVQGNRPPVHGHVLGHWEKNWGRAFPSGWHWAQGVNATSSHQASSSSNASTSSSTASDSSAGRDTSSSSGPASGDAAAGNASKPASGVQAAFVLAGGQVPTPLLPEGWLPDLWLMGVRTPSRSWDLHSYDSIFTVQADPCRSSLLISATQPLARRAVDVQVTAPLDTYGTLEGPTRRGLEPYLDQSLAGYATVRLFELRIGPSERGWVQKHLLEAWEFEMAALEFGGDRRCQRERAGEAGSEESAAAEEEVAETALAAS